MKTRDRRSPARLLPARLFAALVLALGGPAYAGQLDYQVELTGLYSDNIDLSEDEPVAEGALIPRVNFDYVHDSSRLDVEARGSFERRFYVNNKFPDETRGEFAGQLDWTLFPQRLNFVVEDYLTEEPLNFRDGRYPGNLQQVNVFIAGPTFYARLGEATRLQLDVRGADAHAEVSQGFDGNRFGGVLMLERDLNPRTQAGIHLSSTRAEFEDEDLADNYRRHEAYVRLERRVRKFEAELDVGHSRLDMDNTGDQSLTLFRGMVLWTPNSRSRFRLRARSQFADDVQDLVVRLRDPDEDLIPDLVDASSSLVSAGVYRQKMADGEYRYSGDHATLRFRPSYRQFKYIEGRDSDRKEIGMFMQADFRLRPLVTAFANTSWRRREFEVGGQVDFDRYFSVGIEQQLTRHWGWRGELIRNDRDSNLPDAVYKENVIVGTIWWRR